MCVSVKDRKRKWEGIYENFVVVRMQDDTLTNAHDERYMYISVDWLALYRFTDRAVNVMKKRKKTITYIINKLFLSWYS